ncbi:maltose alpha-D-glucosyltransferase [Granulicella cerasi]|uniref:Maltokinase n=1 Tax=Granulicella cerasi TaxID=741063 RepID=A0ABW1Z9X0_9BACT|nr:maltose alpha-D-glucosyltransferase [Granulicella cerasi]
MKKPCSATDPLWYKDAVIYELHVRAFCDSNGDGIGDFQGLISKLDYLQALGVTCLWLLPFFPSPLRDDGYDIADYNSVNPSYGTIEDFQQFLNEAHDRGMQVMIELVINHSSDQHPWFQAARLAPKGSPEREMYVWSDTDKLYDGVRIIFTDTEKSNWTWDEVAQQYYWHRFFSHQPDLNFDNPRVMDEVLNAMRFWMDMGVDGLRLDAIPYLVERDGTSCENVPETHVKIKEIRAVIDAEYENRLILAEANMWPADVRPYFGDSDECHMAFHFPLMPRIYMALRQEDRLPITDIMAQTPEIPPDCQWGLFLRNHDELTLEMVTDDERDYMNMAYASDPRMRVNVGIRRRLAPLVDNNRRRIELLNSLLFSFPGTPIMYYGDEIGMGDNIYLGDRNGVRTPMQWNSDRNAGFSKAVPAKLYFPVIMDPIWGYQAINVEAQESDPSSLLHWTRNMIALRKLFHVFGRGSLEFLHPENRKVLAYVRAYEDERGSETVLCVANLSRFAQPVQLDLSKFAGRQPVEMLGYVPFPTIDESPYALTLAPYSFFWLELQPAPAARPAAAVKYAPTAAAPTEEAITLSQLIESPERFALSEMLKQYLPQQRWFGSKSREVREVRVLTSTPVPHTDALLTVIDVVYAAGEDEQYQLPLAIARGGEAEALQTNTPKNIIGSIKGEPAAVLYDAVANAAFRDSLLRIILESSPSTRETSAPAQHDQSHSVSLDASRSASLDAMSLANEVSRLGSAEQSNTSILYDQKAILKLFRRVRAGENPDVEITRFLTDVAHFPNIPAYLGDLHVKKDQTTLAFLQSFAANEGDGWQWVLDALGRHLASAGADESLDAIRLLGKRTAEMHLALATPTDDPSFAAIPYSENAFAEDRARITAEVTKAFDALAAKQPTLEGRTREMADALLAQRTKLARALNALTFQAGAFGQRIRIHGDYHLGQVLRSAQDFLIVDFEGEPARTLDQRREKQSPLKDVAGMLRSLSYAAHTALQQQPNASPEAARQWELAASSAFMQAYDLAIAENATLIPARSVATRLLAALQLEKASYELLYELNNRPAWLAIPLEGLLAIAEGWE